MIDLNNLTYTERMDDNGVKSITAGVVVKHTICVDTSAGGNVEELARKAIQHAIYRQLYGELRERLQELRKHAHFASDPNGWRDTVRELSEILSTLYPP